MIINSINSIKGINNFTKAVNNLHKAKNFNETTQSIIDIKNAEVLTKAEIKILKVQDNLVGNLLDIIA